MPVTYKQIAEIVGVSRGTVDRALNDRGRIDPSVKKRIQRVAQELGFSPSHVGRALARAKKPVKIGVVVHLAKIPFFQEVIKGIKQAKTEIGNLGGELLVESLPSLDAEAQLGAVRSLLERGIQGLAISPAQDDILRRRLNEISMAKDLPIITFNTDITGLRRMCYVGMDNIQAGRTAAGLMHLLLHEKGGKTLVISGHRNNPANSERVEGFIREAADRFPRIKITDTKFNGDDSSLAYDIVAEAIREVPDLSSIYMVSSGQAGASRALLDAKMAGKIRTIVYDVLPKTREYIQKDAIDFIIDQNAFVQGNRPPHILFDLLFNGRPVKREKYYTDISIRTKYNV